LNLQPQLLYRLSIVGDDKAGNRSGRKARELIREDLAGRNGGWLCEPGVQSGRAGNFIYDGFNALQCAHRPYPLE